MRNNSSHKSRMYQTADVLVRWRHNRIDGLSRLVCGFLVQFGPEFNGMIPEPFPIYTESFPMTAVTTRNIGDKQANSRDQK